MQQIRNFVIIFCVICANSFAQDSGNFSEKTLPDNSAKAPVVNQVKAESDSAKTSEIVAPIKDLKVNETTSIIGAIKDSIGSLLVNKKASSSLMFDDEQISNVDRAIDALKNNQQFVPEDGSAEKSADAAKKEDEKKEKEVAENEKSFVYLASIIYFSPNDWAAWINDQKITNQTNNKDKELYLSWVKNDSAKVVWKLSLSKWRILSGQKSDSTPPNINQNNQVQLEFELKPNQTFALNTNKVLEGRAAVVLLKKKDEVKSLPQK